MKKNLLQEKINTQFPQEKIEVIQYSIMKEPATVKCLKCDTEYKLTKAENFLRKNKKCICKKCINNGSGGRLTLNDFQEKINKKYPNEKLQVLTYELKNKPCSIKCLTCGNIITLKNAESFMAQDKQVICKKCYPNKHKDLQDSIKKFEQYINRPESNFILNQNLTEIIHSNDLISCICKKCGKNNQKTIYDYMRGRQCSCQANNTLKTSEQFKKELSDDYQLLSEYQGANKKVLLRHECGFVYSTTPHNYLSGKGCPKCNRKTSKGEQKIVKFLQQNQINYIQEYPIEIENHKLRFDFYLPDIDCFIEYQGIQHYQPVDYFGGQERFKKQQEYDFLKQQYAKEKLILISYQNFDDIEKILSQNLIKFND